MEVCGTHTMAIARAGIKRLLPQSVRLVSGPGCPVCVTAQTDIDKAMQIARAPNVIMTTFGDMMRVPGTHESFATLKQKGCDIRIVYSCLDALTIARENPQARVVFMGIGFETTSPTIAATIIEAQKQRINNFSVLCCFKCIFPALRALAQSKKVNIDGFICPGHVSVITGSKPYEQFAARYKKPCVITGFEPDDILVGIQRLVAQIKNNHAKVEIEYKRAVQSQGNKTARKILAKVFCETDVEWRGLGVIKKSGLKLRKEFEQFDAEKVFHVKVPKAHSPKACRCAEVIQGICIPTECRLFEKVCTPRNPIGACMVSSEGTCAAYYKYGE